jgi:hypothetical protein
MPTATSTAGPEVRRTARPPSASLRMLMGSPAPLPISAFPACARWVLGTLLVPVAPPDGRPFGVLHRAAWVAIRQSFDIPSATSIRDRDLADTSTRAVAETPARQKGNRDRERSGTDASHRWSGAFEHFHQTFRCVEQVTSLRCQRTVLASVPLDDERWNEHCKRAALRRPLGLNLTRRNKPIWSREVRKE